MRAGACKPAAWPHGTQGCCRARLSIRCVDVGARRQQRLHDGPRQVRSGQVERRRAAAVARPYIQAVPQEPAHLPRQQHCLLHKELQGVLLSEALAHCAAVTLEEHYVCTTYCTQSCVSVWQTAHLQCCQNKV